MWISSLIKSGIDGKWVVFGHLTVLMQEGKNQPTIQPNKNTHHSGKAFSLSRWRLIKRAALKYVPFVLVNHCCHLLYRRADDRTEDNCSILQLSDHSLLNSFFPKMCLLSTLLQLTFLNTNMQSKILKPKEVFIKNKTKQKTTINTQNKTKTKNNSNNNNKISQKPPY